MFDPTVEAVAAEWRQAIVTADAWTPTGAPGANGGITQGFFAQCGKRAGFIKPTSVQNAALPIAAHEKVAADLAQTLQLPVPPVILADGLPNAAHRYQAISLVAFQPAYPWRQIAALPAWATVVAASIVPAASAMVAFDTWIDNRDRMNDGNLLVSQDVATKEYRCAYIDFAHSMTYGWANGPAPPIGMLVGPFPGVPVNVPALFAAIDAIEAMADQEIADVVDRVPGGFWTTDQQKSVKYGLLQRRRGLRSAAVARYGAAP